MGVYIKGMKMPKECGECRWFHFHGETCTSPKYYLDARCELVKSGQDWYGKDSRGGWVGKSISHLPGYGDYYTDEHCVEIGTRANNCPLVEMPEPHGRLIDADALMNIFADRIVKVSERYGIYSAVAGAASGAMKLLDAQPTVIEEEGE